MADQWLHMYHQNPLPNNQLLSDHDSGLVSDSTVVATAPIAKPVQKRSRASRRTPTTLLNTDPANFRAMVQQFTGGPTSNANNTSPNYAVFDPITVAAHHLHAPPHQPPLFQFRNQNQSPPPPFMFSAASEAFFHPTTLNGAGSRINNNNNTNVDYMGLFDGSSPAA